ncbi:hypothetical protein [Sphingomonas sp.]|uniref:hypothetical protein n=1 Tax=Sphingomonas sp. TaxID=28214 RepID=UPI0035A8C2BE
MGNSLLSFCRYAALLGLPQPSSLVYGCGALSATATALVRWCEAKKGRVAMAGLAMVLFIALFAFGGEYFGWSDAGGKVQLALFCCFVFGIICGMKVKG